VEVGGEFAGGEVEQEVKQKGGEVAGEGDGSAKVDEKGGSGDVDGLGDSSATVEHKRGCSLPPPVPRGRSFLAAFACFAVYVHFHVHACAPLCARFGVVMCSFWPAGRFVRNRDLRDC
jgi:hypothetical protein